MISPAHDNGALDMLLAKSYDQRSMAALQRALSDRWQLAKVGTMEYAEYRDKPGKWACPYDEEAHLQYWRRYRECDEIIGQAGVHHEKLEVSFDTAGGIRDSLGGFSRQRAGTLVVDISCVPRMHLTALIGLLFTVEWSERDSIVLAYTRAVRHLPEEERFSVGVKGFAAIPGFSGRIRHRQSVCVIIAGFEGNRAYAAFRHVSPRRAHVMLGDPRDGSRDYYRTVSAKNNHELLANHRVTHSICGSLDPVCFAIELRDVIEKLRADHKPCNVYIVPLGTKLQTVGAVMVARHQPDIQCLFTLPAHRRISAEGVGDTQYLELSALSDRYEEEQRA